jgi:broad specificity phosphatase PhoE
MIIYLVRHAETVLNASRVVQPANTALSELGRLQAGRLAERLADVGIVGIRSSDLPRATETAEAIAARVRVAIERDADLQERDYGDVRGTPYAALTEDIFGPEYAPPGGETWEAFHARVDRAWRRVVAARARVAGPLAVVTHGLVCWSIVSRHVATPAAPTMRFGNTSVTVLRGPEPWRAELVDCTAHLDERRGGAAV